MSPTTPTTSENPTATVTKATDDDDDDDHPTTTKTKKKLTKFIGIGYNNSQNTYQTSQSAFRQPTGEGAQGEHQNQGMVVTFDPIKKGFFRIFDSFFGVPLHSDLSIGFSLPPQCLPCYKQYPQVPRYHVLSWNRNADDNKIQSCSYVFNRNYDDIENSKHSVSVVVVPIQ
ncbi:hypothetical protein BDN72DRAFT_861110, partial [Pluteus cervinus]